MRMTLRRTAGVACLVLAACGDPTRRPPDRPPLIGILETDQVRLWADTSLTEQHDTFQRITLRAAYATPQTVPDDTTRMFISATLRFDISCVGQKVRDVDAIVFDSSVTQYGPFPADRRVWLLPERHEMAAAWQSLCRRWPRLYGRGV